MCSRKSNKINIDEESAEGIDQETLIKVINIYLQEYIHRDNHLWKQNYKFFFASLAVMLLPYLTEQFGITIPEIFNENSWIFPVMGIILAMLFLYVALGLAKRFKAISMTYDRLIRCLPKELQRKSIEDMGVKLLNYTPNYILPCIMFVVLITIAILLLIF